MRYIGSKTRILDFISDTVQQTYGSVDNAVVADLFAGTCAVSEMFKQKKAKVISNDYLHSSYALQVAKIKLNSEPSCSLPYIKAIDALNSLDGTEGFFYNEYSLEGSRKSTLERNYFSEKNAKKIDSICIQMYEWKESNPNDRLDEIANDTAVNGTAIDVYVLLELISKVSRRDLSISALYSDFTTNRRFVCPDTTTA